MFRVFVLGQGPIRCSEQETRGKSPGPSMVSPGLWLRVPQALLMVWGEGHAISHGWLVVLPHFPLNKNVALTFITCHPLRAPWPPRVSL